jgi:uncharacterized protein YkwD
MRRLVAVVVVGWLLGIVVDVSAQSTTKPASTQPSSPYDLGAEDFFARPEVNTPIDTAAIDHALLGAAVFHETNLRRKREGLSLLSHLPALDTAARTHAEAMVSQNFLSHENPNDAALRRPIDRVIKAGLRDPRYVAENIATHFAIRYESGRKVYIDEKRGKKAFSYRPRGEPILPHTYRSFATSLLDQWMDSPGHRANILAPQPTHLGAACELSRSRIGIDQFHCVQVFARL